MRFRDVARRITPLLLLGTAAGSDTPFDLGGVSSPRWESHPALDPQTGDLWFVRSDPNFSGWKLFVSRCASGVRTTPSAMPLAGPGLEADPFFADEGSTFYFISTGPDGGPTSAALDIWTMRRDAAGGWQSPQRLPAPVNSDSAEWFPRPAHDGWLYFGSRRPGGSGKDDIWRARRDRSGRWLAENVGPGLNSAGAEYELEPSADGTWGILATDEGLFRAVNTPGGWRRAGKLDPAINVNGTEIGPLLSPTGRTLMFSRDAGAGRSGEFFLAHLGRVEAWPARCPRKAA